MDTSKKGHPPCRERCPDTGKVLAGQQGQKQVITQTRSRSWSPRENQSDTSRWGKIFAFHPSDLSIISVIDALFALSPQSRRSVGFAVKLKSEKHSALLKKALVTTLVVVVLGGMLIGLAYLLAKKRKPKPAEIEPPKAE